MALNFPIRHMRSFLRIQMRWYLTGLHISLYVAPGKEAENQLKPKTSTVFEAHMNEISFL